jgi:hypothetical protein
MATSSAGSLGTARSTLIGDPPLSADGCHCAFIFPLLDKTATFDSGSGVKTGTTVSVGEPPSADMTLIVMAQFPELA